MMVMDTMAQMFETLVKRIAALGRELDDLRVVRADVVRHTQVPRPLVRGLTSHSWICINDTSTA
jgi:hypothetical protein